MAFPREIAAASARLPGRILDLAPRVREPARKVCGSVHSAVAVCAVIFGAYLFLAGSFALTRWYHDLSPLVTTSTSLGYIIAIGNIAVLFGLLVKRFVGRDDVLIYAMCACLAVCMVATPLSMVYFTVVVGNGFLSLGLWEMPRIGLSLLHMSLLYSFLQELRGELAPGGGPAGRPDPDCPWLKVATDEERPPAHSPVAYSPAATQGPLSPPGGTAA